VLLFSTSASPILSLSHLTSFPRPCSISGILPLIYVSSDWKLRSSVISCAEFDAIQLEISDCAHLVPVCALDYRARHSTQLCKPRLRLCSGASSRSKLLPTLALLKTRHSSSASPPYLHVLDCRLACSCCVPQLFQNPASCPMAASMPTPNRSNIVAAKQKL